MSESLPNTPPSSPAPTPRRSGWRWALSIGLIVVGALIVSYPLWPKLQYAITKPAPVFPYQTNLVSDNQLTTTVSLSHLPDTQNRPVPKDNRLVIPSIGVDMPIYEGPDEKTLDRGGIWHIPKTSDPSKASNTVLSGHRWQYLPPSSRTLYLLDKVQIGEPIIVYWQGKEYDYRVSHRTIVNPQQTDIQDPTDHPQLTIFTCTPLFSTKQRLVLTSDLIS